MVIYVGGQWVSEARMREWHYNYGLDCEYRARPDANDEASMGRMISSFCGTCPCAILSDAKCVVGRASGGKRYGFDIIECIIWP